MYDTFEPFERIKPFEFNFLAKSYKIWKEGNLVKEGNNDYSINFFPKLFENDKVSVVLNTPISEMNSIIDFDTFITSTDRLQMLIIPSETNVENPGINIFRNFLGATRPNFSFDGKTPYCCNLFLINNKIVKVTFSFSTPLILIEFE